VRIHIKEQPAVFKRFGARWTPTLLVTDPEGVERHRIEGFLPADDLLAQLELGIGKIEFAHEHFDKSRDLFKSDFEHHPKAAAVPEARYWMGVSEYKRTNDGRPLVETAKVLHEKYPDSEWARKASVWVG
jgi:hypothetical protein